MILTLEYQKREVSWQPAISVQSTQIICPAFLTKLQDLKSNSSRPSSLGVSAGQLKLSILGIYTSHSQCASCLSSELHLSWSPHFSQWCHCSPSCSDGAMELSSVSSMLVYGQSFEVLFPDDFISLILRQIFPI